MFSRLFKKQEEGYKIPLISSNDLNNEYTIDNPYITELGHRFYKKDKYWHWKASGVDLFKDKEIVEFNYYGDKTTYIEETGYIIYEEIKKNCIDNINKHWQNNSAEAISYMQQYIHTIDNKRYECINVNGIELKHCFYTKYYVEKHPDCIAGYFYIKKHKLYHKTNYDKFCFGKVIDYLITENILYYID